MPQAATTELLCPLTSSTEVPADSEAIILHLDPDPDLDLDLDHLDHLDLDHQPLHLTVCRGGGRQHTGPGTTWRADLIQCGPLNSTRRPRGRLNPVGPQTVH
ncbi:unnamed protein product [Merluccius merluccius]